MVVGKKACHGGAAKNKDHQLCWWLGESFAMEVQQKIKATRRWGGSFAMEVQSKRQVVYAASQGQIPAHSELLWFGTLH